MKPQITRHSLAIGLATCAGWARAKDQGIGRTMLMDYVAEEQAAFFARDKARKFYEVELRQQLTIAYDLAYEILDLQRDDPTTISAIYLKAAEVIGEMNAEGYAKFARLAADEWKKGNVR